MLKSGLLWRCSWWAVTASLTMLAVSCVGLTPPQEVTVVNKTDLRLYVYGSEIPLDSNRDGIWRIVDPLNEDGQIIGYSSILAPESEEIVRPSLWPRGEILKEIIPIVTALTSDGTMVYQEIHTWEEWEQQEWRVEIEDFRDFLN